MKLFLPSLMFSCLVCLSTASRHNSPSQQKNIQQQRPRTYGERINNAGSSGTQLQPMASMNYGTKSPPKSSSSQSTKTANSAAPTESPDSALFGREVETFPDNSMSEYNSFVDQSSSSAAQRSMDDLAEQMKQNTLRRAMQSIKDDEQHQRRQEDQPEMEQHFEQQSMDNGVNSHDSTGNGDIQIAVKSRRKYEFMPVHFDRQTEHTPRMIEIVSDTMPLRLHFRSQSSAIVVSQSHDPTPMKPIEEKVTMDEPYRLAHEVHKPIIQEVREIIQPYRNIVQTLRPVIEDIRTVVPNDRDATHRHKYQEAQIPIPSNAFPSWSQQKPTLRPPPPRPSPARQIQRRSDQTSFKPMKQFTPPIVKKPYIQKSVMHLEASEPEFVYAVLATEANNKMYPDAVTTRQVIDSSESDRQPSKRYDNFLVDDVAAQSVARTHTEHGGSEGNEDGGFKRNRFSFIDSSTIAHNAADTTDLDSQFFAASGQPQEQLMFNSNMNFASALAPEHNEHLLERFQSPSRHHLHHYLHHHHHHHTPEQQFHF